MLSQRILVIKQDPVGKIDDEDIILFVAEANCVLLRFQIYITTKKLPHFAIFNFLFVVSQMQKLQYLKSVGTSLDSISAFVS